MIICCVRVCLCACESNWNSVKHTFIPARVTQQIREIPPHLLVGPSWLVIALTSTGFPVHYCRRLAGATGRLAAGGVSGFAEHAAAGQEVHLAAGDAGQAAEEAHRAP